MLYSIKCELCGREIDLYDTDIPAAERHADWCHDTAVALNVEANKIDNAKFLIDKILDGAKYKAMSPEEKAVVDKLKEKQPVVLKILDGGLKTPKDKEE